MTLRQLDRRTVGMLDEGLDIFAAGGLGSGPLMNFTLAASEVFLGSFLVACPENHHDDKNHG